MIDRARCLELWAGALAARSDIHVADRDSAEWSAEQVRNLEPGFSLEEWVGRRPFKSPEHRALLIGWLEDAGIE